MSDPTGLYSSYTYGLEKQNVQLRNINKTLIADIGRLGGQIKELQNIIRQQQNVINDLVGRIEALQAIIRQQAHIIDILNARVRYLVGVVNAQAREIHRLRTQVAYWRGQAIYWKGQASYWKGQAFTYYWTAAYWHGQASGLAAQIFVYRAAGQLYGYAANQVDKIAILQRETDPARLLNDVGALAAYSAEELSKDRADTKYKIRALEAEVDDLRSQLKHGNDDGWGCVWSAASFGVGLADEPKSLFGVGGTVLSGIGAYQSCT